MLTWLRNLISGWLPIGLNSEGKPKSFGEWFGKIVWVAGIIIAINFINNLFFRPSNTNRPSVIALPFSHVGAIEQSSSQKTEENKRKWWMPIPYISGSAFGEGYSGGETKAGVKAEVGLRLDF